jgi:DNA-binding XRE family transcriptional regulator
MNISLYLKIACIRRAKLWRGVKSFPRTAVITFASNLLRLRKAACLTQERLAKRLDINPRHYQKWEAATMTPSFGVLIRLHKIFKCSWDELLS